MNTISDNQVSDEFPSIPQFKLRTLLAAIWGFAAFIATVRRDFFAFLLAGLPIAWMGCALIHGRRWNGIRTTFFIFWSALGMAICYWFPYASCPIPLPPSAHNLYVSQQGAWLAYHGEVRFHATVEDCVATAQRVHDEYAARQRRSSAPPIEIDSERGIVPPRDGTGHRRKWWLNTDFIRKGLYYPGGGAWNPQIWVDTERGIFYFRVTD